MKNYKKVENFLKKFKKSFKWVGMRGIEGVLMVKKRKPTAVSGRLVGCVVISHKWLILVSKRFVCRLHRLKLQ